jgi:hypothetical protein
MNSCTNAKLIMNYELSIMNYELNITIHQKPPEIQHNKTQVEDLEHKWQICEFIAVIPPNKSKIHHIRFHNQSYPIIESRTIESQ